MTRLAIAAAGSWMACGAIAAPRDTAVSTESTHLVEADWKAKHATERSLALSGNRSATIDALLAVATRCARPDWDGADANPVDLNSVRVAAQLVRSLPEGVPMPEITPEPDGLVSLDWYGPYRRVLSVSASPNGRLAYAWMNGSDRGYGVERFDGMRVPAFILTMLRGKMAA